MAPLRLEFQLGLLSCCYSPGDCLISPFQPLSGHTVRIAADGAVDSGHASVTKELHLPAATWQERILLLTDLAADADLAFDLRYLRGRTVVTASAGPLSTLPTQLYGSTKSASFALRRAREAACKACAKGGSVLIPCSIFGAIFSLIESLSNALQSNGMPKVPIYLLSPVRQHNASVHTQC